MEIGGKVLSFWSWNNKITASEIEEQLNEFANGYFDGVIVHARAGLETEYLSEEWFSLFGVVLEKAKELGLDVYIYDEDGWPSGFAGGRVVAQNPDFCLKRLRYSFGKKNVSEDVIVAAYRKVDDDYVMIDKNIANDDDLIFWCIKDEHYVDLLSFEAVRKFIDITHEEYKKRFEGYFGNVIKGVFTDEPQLDIMLPWSDKLADEFFARFGYELMPALWKIAVEQKDYLKFRNDYFTAVGDLFSCSFTEQIGKWCRENNLVFTGHFACEDGLCGQIATNGGVMQHYTKMQLPGIDHLGNRKTSPVLIKQASSASLQLGNGDVLSETFGCSGWDVPLNRLAWIYEYQSALGVTTACCHLSAFSIKGIRKRDYPAFFSKQNCWWKDFTNLKAYMRGLNDLMREGERFTNTLVIASSNTISSLYNGQDISFRMKDCSAQFRALLENLIDVQLDPEIGDEGLLNQYGKIENGKMVLGKRAYSVVFVADCDSITEKTFLLLKEFISAGGTVFFINRRPTMIDFEKTGKIEALEAFDCCNRRGLLERAVRHFEIERPVTILNSYDYSTAKDFIIHTVKLDGFKRIHIWNGRENSNRNALLCIEGICGVNKVNPITGERTALKCSYSDNCTYFEALLEPMEGMIIETTAELLVAEKSELYSRKRLIPCNISLSDKNSLTIDKAYYIIGENKSEILPVIKISDIIYSKSCTDVEVCYPFYVNDIDSISDITVAVEDDSIEKIEINGTDITALKGNSWIDNCIHEYDISSFVKKGENIVSLYYSISSANQKGNLEEIFETERNRFFYPKEIENIYIRGNFDVVSSSDFENRMEYYHIEEPQFAICAATPKTYGEMTTQGLWFYRGNLEYEFRVDVDLSNKRYLLNVEYPQCAAIRWKIGNNSGELTVAPLKADITDYLSQGENIIKLTVVGTNRNLFGPHHHIRGNARFVGVHTFTGEYGFEDFVSPDIKSECTWDEGYNFVPFGCDSIYLEEYI